MSHESQSLDPYRAQDLAPGVPPVLPNPSVGDFQGDQTGGLIPYKNPQALIAYYLAVFSLIPILGLFFGITAVVLGILGLRARKRNPAIRGSAHAWIGILGGGFTTLLWGGMLLAIVVVGATAR